MNKLEIAWIIVGILLILSVIIVQFGDIGISEFEDNLTKIDQKINNLKIIYDDDNDDDDVNDLINDDPLINDDLVINNISLILTDNRSVEPLNISLNYNIAIEIEELVVEQPTDVKQNTDNVPQKKRNLTIDELTKYRNELLK